MKKIAKVVLAIIGILLVAFAGLIVLFEITFKDDFDLDDEYFSNMYV